ncbi:MAG: hypothetical protein BGO11_10385, partial [Solirubrobacterales bacterium 70-9]
MALRDIGPRKPSIGELLEGYGRREFTPREILADLIARIEEAEPIVHALVATRFDQAMLEATSLDRRAPDASMPLAGIPFVAKDLLDVGGSPTRCGSLTRDDAEPAPGDAIAVARLRRAGAILIGKSRTHEFGWGITTVAADGTGTANPADPTRIAGGSSGGSAAAVAAGEVPLALGTDTAGSVRIPADFCGVVGLRPSPGRIPRCGAFPLAPSLDQVGPLTRTPEDAEIVLDVLAPRCRPGPARDVVFGVSADLAPPDTDPGRLATLERVVAAMRAVGAEVHEVALPEADQAFGTMGTIILAEGLAGHRRLGLWPERASAYGADVRSRLELAEGVGLDEFNEAARRREDLRDRLASIFAEVDVLLGLTSGVGPI